MWVTLVLRQPAVSIQQRPHACLSLHPTPFLPYPSRRRWVGWVVRRPAASPSSSNRRWVGWVTSPTRAHVLLASPLPRGRRWHTTAADFIWPPPATCPHRGLLVTNPSLTRYIIGFAWSCFATFSFPRRLVPTTSSSCDGYSRTPAADPAT